MKPLYFVAGLAMVGLGILGAFLPVMPSTCFFIFALFFFSRSSPKLEAWLLNHRHFGPTLRNWKQHRALTMNSKLLALGGMCLGLFLLLISAAPLFVKIGGIIFILGSAIYVGRLPIMQAATEEISKIEVVK